MAIDNIKQQILDTGIEVSTVYIAVGVIILTTSKFPYHKFSTHS